jgi:hypothetical protein
MISIKCFVLLLSVILSDSTPGVLKNLWITPLQILSLTGGSHNTFDDHISAPILSKKRIDQLKLNFMNSFENFRLNSSLINSYRLKYDIHEDASDSDIYFFYQRDSFTMESSGFCREYSQQMKSLISKLLEVILTASRSFLIENSVTGSTSDTFEVGKTEVIYWVSIHANGTYHQSHHHKGSAISGVFYVSVPNGAGSITFEDPRGSLPPFGKIIKIIPAEGDLILFPSWLVHRVDPTLSTDPRISLSFNIGTDWETLSDVNFGRLSN